MVAAVDEGPSGVLANAGSRRCALEPYETLLIPPVHVDEGGWHRFHVEVDGRRLSSVDAILSHLMRKGTS